MLLTASLLLVGQSVGPIRGFAPTFLYEKISIEGFDVYVSPEVRGVSERRAPGLAALHAALLDVLHSVPSNRISAVLGMSIWLEWDLRDRGVVVTYLSQTAKELREVGVNPDKAQGIEVSNLRTFLGSDALAARSILSALAIAYLHKSLAPGRDAIETTFRRAMEDGLYALSAEKRKLETRSYPSVGPDEYFAILTLAYFDRNNFYPFNRRDLRDHDSRGAALMAQVWDSN